MLYTGRGDKGDTSLFACKQRLAKSSALIEALGTVDEVNSWLGVCKVEAEAKKFVCVGRAVLDVLNEVQQNLFIIQAELAGAPKTVSGDKVEALGHLIGEIEKILPPIKSFFVSGGTPLSAYLDYARTIARRAERRVVACPEAVGEHSLAYLNRLSSILYALARLANHQSGIKEESPTYQ